MVIFLYNLYFFFVCGPGWGVGGGGCGGGWRVNTVVCLASTFFFLYFEEAVVYYFINLYCFCFYFLF